MKTIKKLMAALLAVALLCAMAVPAFAAEGAATGSGTITIDKAINGETYTAYKFSMSSVPKWKLTAA